MKNLKKLLSVVLVALLVITAAVSVGITVSATTGTLTSYYATNPDGKMGVQKTITVDGAISDWDSTMLIAQGTANDDPRVYRPNSMHENPIDLYALYGAYDDTNLYLMWEMTNVQDMVASHLDYPLAQGHLYQTENVPFYIAIDTGKSDVVGNGGKTPAGGTLWNSNIAVETSYNRMIAISTNGSNGPYIYSGDSTGINPQEIYTPSTSGITFKWGEGILSSQVNGIDKGFGTENNRVPGDMCSDSSAWVNFNAKGHNSSKYDFHYEMSIPLSKLGITKSDITTNGIGALLIATYGKSGMDCLPYDLAMNDNADQGDTESQAINSKEKSDEDNVTVQFARIGAQGGDPVQPGTDATDPVQTDPVQTDPVQSDPVNNTLTVNATSNYFSTSSQSGLNAGDTVTVKYDLTSNMNVASAQWNLTYDTSKLRLLSTSDNMCPVTGGTITINGNRVLGNFTNASSMYNFSSGGTFVQAQFEVLGTGSTSVNLNVNELNVGYRSGNTLYLASAVENGQVKNIKNETGFSDASITPSSQVTKGTTGSTIKINATSNLFESSNAVINASADKATVTYKLTSSMGVVNSQWKLTYDPSKLSFDYAAMPKIPNAMIIDPQNGLVRGNFANLNPTSFSSSDSFVTATFNIIGTGETTVNLDVEILSVGYVSGTETTETALVENSVVKNITGQSGFSGYTYSTGSEVYEGTPDFMRGDVNGDKKVTINDATIIQRYLAEYRTLTSRQMLAADADKNGKVSIRDVTEIQRAIAEICVLPE